MAEHSKPVALGLDDALDRRRHEAALRGLIAGEVRFGAHDRMLYATDASMYQVEPIGVVIPRGVDDLQRVVEYCRDERLPMLPRGGGTSLAGQCVSRAVVIDVSPTLTGLEWVSEEARACGVQPGITIDDLNDRLRGHGLFFAPDPATARQCNIGGAIGNNAAGTRSIRYGRTSESVEAVELLLSTGETVTLARGSGLTEPIARRLSEGVIDICRRYEPFIRERFPKTLRRNAGYGLDGMLADIDEAAHRGVDPLETLNLARLVCGSEGTLGIVTHATLRLHPVPKAKGLAVIGFASMDEAIDAVVPLLGLHPSAVELLDDMVIGLARENIECREFVELMPQPGEKSGEREARSEESKAGPRPMSAPRSPLSAVLYVEFFSDHGTEEIAERFDRLRALIAERCPSAGVACYTDPESMARALKLRKAGEPLLHGVPGSRKPLGFVEDNAVPVERLSEFVREFKRIVACKGTVAAFYAHASVGVLHVRPLLDLRDPADRKAMEEIAVEVSDLARSLGGVMSGEHGDGRARGPLLERYFGSELMRAFREVKALFDPMGLMNPGNIVPLGEHPESIESIHERTRVRPAGFDLHAAPAATWFDYEREGGFDHAVELCNGAGVCRKKQGGTMCPSYMATLDERHSTRGRGNALRLAVTGQAVRAGSERAESDNGSENGSPLLASRSSLSPAWNDPETLATLDLCLSCKACKTECPSNVDIAQYKAEYLAQSYRARERVPLRARVFGHVRLLNRIGSALAPVSNFVAAHPLHRAIVDRLLGLAPRRTLPRFERSLFRRVTGVPPPAPSQREGEVRNVLLYGDCFTAYNEPRIGEALLRVLGAFGYRALVVDAGCCGRALISTGLLDDAARTVARTAARLVEAVEQGGATAVLVCEPSCLSAIKDEWLSLRHAGPERDRLRRLASMSFLPEDFLDREWEHHPRRPAFVKPEGAVALHGHCHQKALWGAATSARLLRRLTGDSLRVLDSGCCGMAGSFGYTKERYDLSMKIGELSLFPAVRSLGPGDVLVAPGTSCRHQVHDGCAREAMHPIELVDRLMVR